MNDDDTEWKDDCENEDSARMEDEFRNLLKKLQDKTAHALKYLVAEGFLEKVGEDRYEYTPEGYVIVMNEMKRLLGDRE